MRAVKSWTIPNIPVRYFQLPLKEETTIYVTCNNCKTGEKNYHNSVYVAQNSPSELLLLTTFIDITKRKWYIKNPITIKVLLFMTKTITQLIMATDYMSNSKSLFQNLELFRTFGVMNTLMSISTPYQTIELTPQRVFQSQRDHPCKTNKMNTI